MLFTRLDGIPEPPAGYVPPMGSSRNTWTNIYKNKGRIDYCVQQFGVRSLPPVSISSSGATFIFRVIMIHVLTRTGGAPAC